MTRTDTTQAGPDDARQVLESLPEMVERLTYMLGPDTDFDNYTFSIKRGTLRRLLAALASREG